MDIEDKEKKIAEVLIGYFDLEDTTFEKLGAYGVKMIVRKAKKNLEVVLTAGAYGRVNVICGLKDVTIENDKLAALIESKRAKLESVGKNQELDSLLQSLE